MCTNYVSSPVQDSNGKVLSYKQKCKHANSIGTHLELVCQSRFTQHEETKNTNNKASTVSKIQATESNGSTDPGYRQQRKDLGKGVWHGTADPNNVIQSDNDKEQGPQKPDAKQIDKRYYIPKSTITAFNN